MPARLRVRRRSLNAPQAGAAACQAAFGAAGFSSPTSRLRLRGVRATRGARSAERGNFPVLDTVVARHRRHAMVSRASFAFPRGHASRATVRGVNARVPTLGLAPGCPSISIWLANGAKVGTLLWLGTFIVWIVHGSATTFPNLIQLAGPLAACPPSTRERSKLARARILELGGFRGPDGRAPWWSFWRRSDGRWGRRSPVDHPQGHDTRAAINEVMFMKTTLAVVYSRAESSPTWTADPYSKPAITWRAPGRAPSEPCRPLIPFSRSSFPCPCQSAQPENDMAVSHIGDARC